jgi:hypothetical protein
MLDTYLSNGFGLDANEHPMQNGYLMADALLEQSSPLHSCQHP